MVDRFIFTASMMSGMGDSVGSGSGHGVGDGSGWCKLGHLMAGFSGPILKAHQNNILGVKGLALRQSYMHKSMYATTMGNGFGRGYGFGILSNAVVGMHMNNIKFIGRIEPMELKMEELHG
jgi:hypothetical protein